MSRSYNDSITSRHDTYISRYLFITIPIYTVSRSGDFMRSDAGCNMSFLILKTDNKRGAYRKTRPSCLLLSGIEAEDVSVICKQMGRWFTLHAEHYL